MEAVPVKKESTVYIRTSELCDATGCSTETVVSLVEYGILEPGGSSPDDWRFEEQHVCRLRKAIRLKRDFDTDIAGAALALELLDRLERARLENRELRRRLGRFLSD